ncbi:hypothetical protein VTL71DRAFT_4547 [Oculimacula yallundae]|uniref:FHA domain-containing protein n=1 Tax=Oculimacula yallundae TaxID=86028 RepID=A0ABR4C2C7_9HELO
MGSSLSTPNVQNSNSEYRGIHTSLYTSLPEDAVQLVEKAIWLKMIGRTDDARSIFVNDLGPFERIPVVTIEHAELELEAGKWGKAWRILDARLNDPEISGRDLEHPEYRLMSLTRAMLGTRHRGDLMSSTREIERTQVWLGNVPVSDYTDIQTSCIRRYVISNLFTKLYNGYNNPEAEHVPEHNRLDSSGSRMPWGGLRQLRRSLNERGMYNEAHALFRVEVNRTPLEYREPIFEEFLGTVASLPSTYRGQEFVEASIRLQWAVTHVQTQENGRAAEEFSESELAFDRFCERFDVANKHITPHMQGLDYEKLSMIDGPVDRLDATEALANRFEAIDGFKTGMCLNAAAELALAFYRATAIEDFQAIFFRVQTRLERYDREVSEDICDLIHHHIDLSSATHTGMVDRQNALEWIEGFFVQYPHFDAPLLLASLYRSKQSLLKGLRRLEDAEIAEQRAVEYEAYEPSLGRWLHIGHANLTLPSREGDDLTDTNTQEDEVDDDEPFYSGWSDAIGDEVKSREKAIQLVVTWLNEDIAAEDPALQQYGGITASSIREVVFTKSEVDDASKKERYSQIFAWLGDPPRGQRNTRLFCLQMLRDSRQLHLESKKLWDLRIAELEHLIELEKRLPRVVRQTFPESESHWLGALALTHLACLDHISDFTDDKSLSRLVEAETCSERAIKEFRQRNAKSRVAVQQRSGAQICMLKIIRLKQLAQQAALVANTSFGNTMDSVPEGHDTILPAEVVTEIEKIRDIGINKSIEADSIFSQGELHASRSAGLDGITNRQNLTAFYGSAYTAITAISLLLAEPGKLSVDSIKNAWQWVQKYKARSLARTIGARNFDPPELIKQIMATPETATLYQEMLARKKKIDEATAISRFDLHRQLEGHLQFMRGSHDLLRQLIDLREATPFELSDIASIEAQCKTDVVLVDWFHLPGYVLGEPGRLLMFTASSPPKNNLSESSNLPKDEPKPVVTMDLLTTTLEDVTKWQNKYLSPIEYKKIQEENLNELGARDEFDKTLGGLVAPLAQHVKAGKLIVLCPSSQLHRLPLHALSIQSTGVDKAGKVKTTSTSLIHRNPCVYTHSHSLLRSTFAATQHTRSSPGPMVPQMISGIPESNSKDQAGRDSIRRLALRFHTDPMIDEKALKEHFLDVAKDSRLLHLHTHCIWKSENPLDHAIQLPRLASLDNSLDEEPIVDTVKAREFFDVQLSSGTHVNIIACQGGVTDLRLGDEVMGLGPALLCSGASSIVSTLWRIDDKHGVSFEKAFFDSFMLQAAKKTKKKKVEVNADRSQLGADDTLEVAEDKNKVAVRMVNLAKAMQAAAKEMDEGQGRPLYEWAGYVLHGCWQFTILEEEAISLL